MFIKTKNNLSFYVISFLIFALICGTGIWLMMRSYSRVPDVVTKKPVVQKIEIKADPIKEAQYQKDIKRILEKFNSGETAENIRAELLELTVPSFSYREIHLDLVIIFDQLAQAQEENDLKKQEEILNRLKEFKTLYPWTQ